jgi:hypothetical protein
MPWKKGQSGNPATRFRPGRSGNPGGRPKGPTIATRLRKLLDQPGLDGEASEKPIADRIAEMIVREALAGDIRFIREILDRTEGKVTARAVGGDEVMEPPGPDQGALEVAATELEAWRRRMIEKLPRSPEAPLA